MRRLMMLGILVILLGLSVIVPIPVTNNPVVNPSQEQEVVISLVIDGQTVRQLPLKEGEFVELSKGVVTGWTLEKAR